MCRLASWFQKNQTLLSSPKLSRLLLFNRKQEYSDAREWTKNSLTMATLRPAPSAVVVVVPLPLVVGSNSISSISKRIVYLPELLLVVYLAIHFVLIGSGEGEKGRSATE
jgi:hypothetical protein